MQTELLRVMRKYADEGERLERRMLNLHKGEFQNCNFPQVIVELMK
jgi:hypothetical protein